MHRGLTMSDEEKLRRHHQLYKTVTTHTSHTWAAILAKKLLERLGWSVEDVDLWEVNEAFAVVPMAFMQEMNIPRDKVNVNGGAIALGHPLGMSGARLVVALTHELARRGARTGLATLCVGVGQGEAALVERVEA